MDERPDDRRRVALLEEAIALGIDAARRGRVEDDRAADRRLAPQHDAIAASRDHRRCQAQLGVARRRRGPRAPGSGSYRGGRRAALPSRIGASSVSATSSRYERGNAPGCDERVTAADLRRLDAGETDGDPLSGLRPAHRCVVHLDRSHAHVSALRLEPEVVALGDRARPQCPGDDRADPPEREDAVDVQAGGKVGSPLLHCLRDGSERGAELVEPGAGHAAHRDDLRPGDELARLLDGELERLRVHGVRLRDGDDSALHAKEPQDREVLVGLGRAPSAASTTRRKRSIPVAPATIVRTNRSWPGNVDERERTAVGQLERRIAEVDRDPAGALLRQPVGVLAGERADERRLAVVDVTRGADRQRHGS